MPKEGGHRETPMFVTIAGPNNLSMVKVSAQGDESFDDDDEFPFRQGGDGGARKGGRGQSARQLSWSILLRALNVFGCLASLASHVASLCCAARRRVASGRTDSDLDADSRPAAGRSRFYSCIKVFLWLSIVMLAFEVAAYYKGWHIGAAELGDWRLRAEELRRLVEPYSSLHVGDELRRIVEPYSSFDVQGQLRRIVRLYSSLDLHGIFGAAYAAWVTFRVLYIAPQLQLLANACIVLFIIQTVDRVALCLGCFWVKLRGIKPIPKYNPDDLESGGYYPMVLIQIPMCNEKEVYQQSIGAVCNLDWPSENMLVQVLDDSDDPITQTLIREEVEKWKKEGVKIVYHHRVLREGYKAGNLKNAMSCAYVKDYEFVVIFDADFQPASDYLKRTMPHFKGNEELGLVQARWSFVNKDENLLTRLQNINLCFHFEVEQQVNGVYLNFFGFNGTAGVWRKKALEDSGGWLERTTVEDMDIAVRAHLNGWKFIFLNDVECQCELPESYEAYRKQQHRWHSGPMQLFRLCFMDIIRSKIGFWKKFNLIFLFFLLRKLILPFYSFTLFCIILPLTMFVPESNLPAWVVCYIPATMSLLNILPSPRSFPFIVPYLLFENTMSVTKFNAMISGLFQLGSAYKWEVTKKSGRSSEGDLMSLIEKEPKQQRGSSEPNLEALSKKEAQPKKASKRKHNRIYLKELSLAFLLLTAAARSLLSEQGIHFYFLLFQGVSFLLVGLDLIGEQID